MWASKSSVAAISIRKAQRRSSDISAIQNPVILGSESLTNPEVRLALSTEKNLKSQKHSLLSRPNEL